MDFEKAIAAHTDWKNKLARYIHKPDHSLDAAIVSRSDTCELGKWLSKNGVKYAQLPGFLKLVADHKKFHVAAGDIIKKADSGQKMTDEVALGAKSEYATASSAVVMELMRLKRVA